MYASSQILQGYSTSVPELNNDISRRLYISTGLLVANGIVFLIADKVIFLHWLIITAIATIIVTGVFIYCFFPLYLLLRSEIKSRKPGPVLFISVALIIFWLQGLYGLFMARDFDELSEFSVVLFCVMSGFSMALRHSHKLNDTISRQKKQLDNILESIDEVIWSMRTDTLDLLYVNAACEKVTGYKAKELLADKNIFLESIYPEDKEMFYTALEKAIMCGHAVCEFRVYHKRGGVRFLRGEAKLQKRPDGVPILNGITMDITQQCLAEMQFHSKAKEVENILNSISDAFFAIDNNYTICYVNKEFEALYRMSARDLIGLSFLEVAPRYFYKDFYEESSRAIRQQKSISFEMYCQKFDKWFLYKVYPTENGASIYFTDITDKNNMIKQMVSDKGKLEAQNEKLSEIAWIQSHKVRAPLANIMGLVHLLNISEPTHPDNLIIMDGILTSCKQLDTVIREISDKANSLEMADMYKLQYIRHN